jgi:hypothetical protein
MNRLGKLYDLALEAEEMFEKSHDPDVKNELSQALCVTRTYIPLIEAGDKEAEEMIEETILLTERCIRKAVEIVDPAADTERSPEFKEI